VLSRESVAYKVLREIRNDLPRFGGRRIAIALNPRVAELLLGTEREALAEMEQRLGRQIEVRAVPGVHQEHFEVIALDEGPPVPLRLPWLGLGGEPEPEPEIVSEPFEPDVPEPAPVPGPIEGRPEVVLAELESEDRDPLAPTEAVAMDPAEPDPVHLAPPEELEPRERRGLVTTALSPAGEIAAAAAEPVDETSESRILPAFLAPEREES
jgi:hypothetical protein